MLCEIGKKVLKPVKVFLLCRETFPGFAVIDEETGLIDKLEGDADDLLEDVVSVTGGGVVTAILDPFKKGLNRLVYVIRGAEDRIVFLQICGGDVGVGGVQVIKDGTSGGEAISDILVLEGSDEHFVNSVRRICRRASLVRSYLLKSAEAVSKA